MLDVPVQKVHKIAKAKDVFRRPGSLKEATAVLQRNVSLIFQNVTFYWMKSRLFGFPSVLISLGWSAKKHVAPYIRSAFRCRAQTDSHLRSSIPQWRSSSLAKSSDVATFERFFSSSHLISSYVYLRKILKWARASSNRETSLSKPRIGIFPSCCRVIIHM